MSTRVPLSLAVVAACSILTATAQNRDLRTQKLVLDDNNNNIVTIQTPTGPITGGTLTIPDPAGAGQFLISTPSGGTQSVSGHLLPGNDNLYDLGSATFRWRHFFLSGNVQIGSGLRITEPGGTDYTAFVAQAQANNITYTLPAANGTAGQVLAVAAAPAPTATAATLEWVPAISNWSLTGNAGTTAGTNFVGTTDNVAFEIRVNNGGAVTGGNQRVMRYEPNGTSANIIGGFNGNSVGGGVVGAVIGGGGFNGSINQVTAGFGMVGGGSNNTASGSHATVGGGSDNTASGSRSTVGGGSSNTASGNYSAVGGGLLGVASADNSTVGGGFSNTAAGAYSTIPGGQGLTLATTAERSFGFHANTAAADRDMTISASDVAVFGNTDLWLANNDGGPSELRFFEAYNNFGAFPNTANYTAFKAQTQTGDITYTLPAANGTDGQVLRLATGATATAGTLEWATASSDWGLTGNAGTTAGTNFVGTTDNVAFEIRVNNGGAVTGGNQRVMRYEPNGTSANIIGGFNGNSVTSGVVGATVSGGGVNANVNVVTDDYGVVGGGRSNRAGDNAGTTSDHGYATVGGGRDNTASQEYATVGGGYTNTASGVYSTVSGGRSNTAAGDYSTIPGGFALTLDANADGSFGFLGGNTGSNSMTISAANVAVFGNTDLWLANNDNAPSELRFFEAETGIGAFPSSTNYTAFKAASAQTGDITYTLPATAPSSDERLLLSTSTGTLSWGRRMIKVTVNKNLNSVAANASSVETFTVTGAPTSSSVVVSPQNALTDGLIISYARVSASGTVEVKFRNETGAAIDEAAMDFYITVID